VPDEQVVGDFASSIPLLDPVGETDILADSIPKMKGMHLKTCCEHLFIFGICSPMNSQVSYFSRRLDGSLMGGT